MEIASHTIDPLVLAAVAVGVLVILGFGFWLGRRGARSAPII